MPVALRGPLPHSVLGLRWRVVPTVPLKGWDGVATWAGRNSRSGLCFRVALVGDYMGDCLC